VGRWRVAIRRPRERRREIEMTITVERAVAAERDALANLLQLYLYDFSEFDDEEADVDATGRFQTAIDLDPYFARPDWHPFLFRAGGRLAGFALVHRLNRPGGEPSWGMAEFFVLRRYRRRGLGRRAARDLFDRFPGRWEVGELRANAGAVAFWRRVIDEYTGGRFSEEGADDPASDGPLQVFRAPG
jgi:predicted acetyltransferase